MKDVLTSFGVMFVGLGAFLLFFLGLYALASLFRGKWKERAMILPFAGPGFFLVFAGLFVGTIRTIIVSFKDADGLKSVGLANYKEVFKDTGLRLTVVNSFVWVIVGTFLTVYVGLLIARFADGMKGEKAAKSLIFVPVAISLVGTGIIWKFIYDGGGTFKLGLLNQLTKSLSNRFVFLVFLALLLWFVAWLARLAIARFAKQTFVGWGPRLVTLCAGMVLGTGVWLLLGREGLSEGFGGNGDRIWLLERGLGSANPPGETWPGVNTFLLIIVFVWAQAGIATVILSSALKGVPQELLEAARIDGATNGEIFRRVSIPYIKGTIMTVITLTMLGALKGYGLIAAATGGRFGTSNMANEVFFKLFVQYNDGLGSALAVLLFVLCFPVLILNRIVQQRVAETQ
jgi:alpha-glucoside transport system permease protein